MRHDIVIHIFTQINLIVLFTHINLIVLNALYPHEHQLNYEFEFEWFSVNKSDEFEWVKVNY